MYLTISKINFILNKNNKYIETYNKYYLCFFDDKMEKDFKIYKRVMDDPYTEDMEKSKAIKQCIKEISIENNKEKEERKISLLIDNFCNSDICQNLNSITKQNIKAAASDYCTEKIIEMEKRQFIAYVRDFYAFADIFGLDNELKNKLYNSLNKYLDSLKGLI